MLYNAESMHCYVGAMLLLRKRLERMAHYDNGREVQRLRTRAEAAERAAAASVASEQIVNDLHTRLRQSDERVLRGEALVAKLRAFIRSASGTARV